MDSNNNENEDQPQSLILEERNNELEQKINNVRSKFLMKYLDDPKSFHENDIELVKQDDWWTLRFIKWHRGNEEKALKQMINTFKWRKSFGMHDRNISDLPIEFAKSAALFPLGVDYKGRNVVYTRVKVYRKIQVLNLFFQQFVAGIIDYVDKKSGPNGYVLVFDVSGMGWSNIDLEFLQFMVQLTQSYYPYGIRYTICHNVPRFLKPLWAVAKMFVGSNAERTFRFSDGDEIRKYIPVEQLPRYLGGDCDFDFTDFEETRGCPSVRDLASKHGFTQDDVDKYYKMFEEHLLEAEKLAKLGTKTTNCKK